MRLDGGLPDEEFVGDLGVGAPAPEQREDVALTRGERGQSRVRLGGGLLRRAPFDDATRHLGGEQRVAVTDGSHRLGEFVGVGVLEQEPARSGVERDEEVVVAIEGREDDDAAQPLFDEAARGPLRLAPAYAARGFSEGNGYLPGQLVDRSA